MAGKERYVMLVDVVGTSRTDEQVIDSLRQAIDNARDRFTWMECDAFYVTGRYPFLVDVTIDPDKYTGDDEETLNDHPSGEELLLSFAAALAHAAAVRTESMKLTEFRSGTALERTRHRCTRALEPN